MLYSKPQSVQVGSQVHLWWTVSATLAWDCVCTAWSMHNLPRTCADSRSCISFLLSPLRRISGQTEKQKLWWLTILLLCPDQELVHQRIVDENFGGYLLGYLCHVDCKIRITGGKWMLFGNDRWFQCIHHEEGGFQVGQWASIYIRGTSWSRAPRLSTVPANFRTKECIRIYRSSSSNYSQ